MVSICKYREKILINPAITVKKQDVRWAASCRKSIIRNLEIEIHAFGIVEHASADLLGCGIAE